MEKKYHTANHESITVVIAHKYYDRQDKELTVSEWVIVVKLQIGILFSGISWREQVNFQ
jgi:hypothetical protein